MTSKNLLFNFMKENLKRRIWVFALGMLVFFFAFPVTAMMKVQMLSDEIDPFIIQDIIAGLAGKNNLVVHLIAFVAAVICAVNGFSYLHDKKKVDFYHSIPVKREVLFFTSYINGVFIYIVSYLINLFLVLLVIAANGYFNSVVLGEAITSFLLYLIGFLLIYHTTIVAMMLTGHLIIALLGTGVLSFYGALLPMLIIGYYETFYATFYQTIGVRNIALYLSPVFAYSSMQNEKGLVFSICYSLFLILLTFVISFLLYKKRKSEAAERAMAFEISKPIVKFFILILCSLGGGLFFKQFAYAEGDLWFLFGLWMGLLLSHVLVEIIYDFDIKAVFKHKRQMLFAATAVCIIAGIFRFDVFSYDIYLPKEEKIVSAAVSLDLDNQMRYYYLGTTDAYRLDNMQIKNVDNVIELAKAGIAFFEEGEAEDVRTISAIIKYHLKNGKEVSRRYHIPNTSSNLKVLNQIYTDPEYKKGVFPIYGEKGTKYTTVNWEDYSESKKLALKQEKLSELIEIYKKELLDIDLYQVQDEVPYGLLTFSYQDQEGGEITQSYCVYPSCKETIAFLNNYGVTMNSVLENPDRIVSIKVENYQDRKGSDLDTETLVFTDPKEIKEITEFIIPQEYSWNQSSMIPIFYDVNVEIEYKNSSGSESSMYNYSVRSDKISEEWKKKLVITEESF